MVKLYALITIHNKAKVCTHRQLSHNHTGLTKSLKPNSKPKVKRIRMPQSLPNHKQKHKQHLNPTSPYTVHQHIQHNKNRKYTLPEQQSSTILFSTTTSAKSQISAHEEATKYMHPAPNTQHQLKPTPPNKHQNYQIMFPCIQNPSSS
eukprot:gene3078-2060_t